MNVQLDRKSEAYKRVTAAGFSLQDPMCWFIPENGFWMVMQVFRCVCGTEEATSEYYVTEPTEPIDGAKMVEDAEALSADHLRGDGYTEAEIAKIRAPYDGVTGMQQQHGNH